MAEPGQVLDGRYRLDARIAAGGMGEVWRGTDLALSRAVAVKLLHPEQASRAEGLARFRAEAQHAGSLSHPNIAQVYDYCEPARPEPAYLVLELVDGPSLAQELDSGPISPERTLDVIEQAASGLAAAHRSGLLHRDIKPGNLLLSRDGLIKITDFGIARLAGSPAHTQTGALTGTPAYLAPERVIGSPATPAADLYALGVVAHQCLTGQVPFAGEPLVVALAQVERDMPPLPESVPPALAALVTDLTRKDPQTRPASAIAVVARASLIRADLPGAAPTPTGTGPLRTSPAGTSPLGISPAGTSFAGTSAAASGAAAGGAAGPAAFKTTPTGDTAGDTAWDATAWGRTRTSLTGISLTETGHTGPDPTGTGYTGPDSTGTSHTGPDSTGTSHTGPDPTGTSRTGPNPTGTSRTGPDPTGTSFAGTSAAGAMAGASRWGWGMPRRTVLLLAGLAAAGLASIVIWLVTSGAGTGPAVHRSPGRAPAAQQASPRHTPGPHQVAASQHGHAHGQQGARHARAHHRRQHGHRSVTRPSPTAIPSSPSTAPTPTGPVVSPTPSAPVPTPTVSVSGGAQSAVLALDPPTTR